MSASVNVVAALLLIAAVDVCADESAEPPIDEPTGSATLIGRMGLKPYLDPRASTAPRLTSERTRLVGTEPLAKGSDGRPPTELGGVSYRWWLSRGRSDLGVGVGAEAPAGAVAGPAP